MKETKKKWLLRIIIVLAVIGMVISGCNVIRAFFELRRGIIIQKTLDSWDTVKSSGRYHSRQLLFLPSTDDIKRGELRENIFGTNI